MLSSTEEWEERVRRAFVELPGSRPDMQGRIVIDNSSTIATAARLLKENYAGAIDEMASRIPRPKSLTPEEQALVEAELARHNAERAAQLEVDREEWRRTESVFVVQRYAQHCCGDDDEPLSWWGSEAEAQAEAERLNAENNSRDFGWFALPKGRR